MLRVYAPRQAIFLISLILAIIAWIGWLISVPYVGEHPSLLMTIAFIVLAAGCLLDRMPAGR